MKIIAPLLIATLALTSCSHAPAPATPEVLTPALTTDINVDSSIVDELSPQELAIHQCLSDKNKLESECLKGTEFSTDQTRVPASTQVILARYSNFFNDHVKLSRFNKWVTVVRRAAGDIKKQTGDYVNGKGFGVTGAAYIGPGVEWMAEFSVSENELGLYCTPGVGITNDVGAGMGVYALQTFSCDGHGDAENLSFSAGVGLGANAGLDLGYGFGFDSQGLRSAVLKARTERKLDPKQVALELDFLKKNPKILSELPNNEVIIYFGVKTLNYLNFSFPDLHSLKAFARVVAKLAQNPQSLGMDYKKSFGAQGSQDFFKRHRLTHLRRFLSIVDGALTGCDSVGGTISIGLGMATVPVSAFYERSGLLFQMSVADIRALAAVTPLTLLNPTLIKPKDLRIIAGLSERVLEIPRLAKKKCFSL